MSKTIVIVGNGKPDHDVSAAVDDGDVVVRFNAMLHYGSKYVGRRTTVLVLRINWIPKVSPRACPWLPRAVAGRPLLWCICASPTEHPAVTRREALMARANIVGGQQHAVTIWDARRLATERSLRPHLRQHKWLNRLPYAVIGEASRLSLEMEYKRRNAVKHEASSGMIVTAAVLADPRYCGWDVKLAGFAMSADDADTLGTCHPLKAERSILAGWVREGRVSVL